MPAVLDGIRVIDFGHFVAGPLVGEILAQNGADVLHIDPPGGPRLGGLPDAFLNRGKRRTVLDLRRDNDLETARELCVRSDVVVENFRPGVMDRFGLGAAEMTASNPGLIYCSLPGFATTDPRSPSPAWEGVVMSATAGYRRLRDHWDWKARASVTIDDPSRPVFTGLPIASTTAALLATLKVASALYRRERTGSGAHLEVPLAEAMLEVVGFHLEMPDFVSPREDLPKAFLGSYRCADGGFIDQVSYPRFVQRLLTAAGEWDSWCAAGLGDMPKVFTDPVLKRVAERRFVELIGTRPAEYWERIFQEIGSSAVQVGTPADWLANEHARQSRTVVQLDDPEFGPLAMAGVAMDFSETPATVGPRSLPGAEPGSMQRVLDKPARDDAVVAGAEEEPPLAGVSVLELSQVVAGPVSGRLLADLGADVVKVANPAPDGNNGFHGSYTNRGKQTAYLNLQDPDEFALVRAAADHCDVLLQNYAYGAIERYGLGYDALRDARPDLVYVSMSAYGRTGPWRHRRGHENQAVAVTGLSSRYGGEQGWPMYQPYLISDVGTGIMGALAAVLGLFHRARTGRGQEVSTSLTNVATLHQAIYLFDVDNPQARLPEPTGVDSVGWSPLQRLYQASDGWLFLAAAPGQEDVLRRTLGLPPDRSATALADETAAILRQHNRSHWTALLGAEGIAAQPVRELDDVANDPCWHGRHVLRHALNGEGQVSPVLGFSASPWPIPELAVEHPGPLGANTAIVRSQFRHMPPLGKQ
ncbi:CaiB/BaiF CoA transferase family protein [Nocardia aobensis]|uniref:CaiB/BaiF CoA transferase family protein n=1 Tax=Nocardia aobensis TaxID=257277 RepID=A0ABW6PFL6_9NOCA